MPNLNAALGCAQMEVVGQYLKQKKMLAQRYEEFFNGTGVKFVVEPEYAQSNYWLNAIICPDKESREEFLNFINNSGIMVRPIWKLMHRLPMFESALRGDLTCSELIEGHLLNLPSTPVEIKR